MGAHAGTSPLTQRELIAEYFMEHRVQVLELAAFLDRLDRARELDGEDDFRMWSVQDALRTLVAATAQQQGIKAALEIRDPDR